ncbi:MAG: SDR family NAD(P)-dependent oxidoreductase [Verrucomicrobia bacterium]|nr:SDR family NAD(P)-dependent oxidoreductase [Verrucomicrobiota bacterium]
MKAFENKVVLITGGGTGIGKATAIVFLAEGAKVVISGRRQSVLQATTKELGTSAHFVVGDVSKSGEPKAIVDEAIAKCGQLDVLVNNAGAFSMGPLMETSDEEIERIYRTNVFATLALSREALPHLIKTKGSIINISSTVSSGVMAGSSVYASSKAAVDHITRNLAAEYGPSGVRVNAVAPGLTATDMSTGVRSDEQMLTMMVGQTPLGRLGEPSDIAKAVLLLAGDEAGWITGQIVQASGGLML